MKLSAPVIINSKYFDMSEPLSENGKKIGNEIACNQKLNVLLKVASPIKTINGLNNMKILGLPNHTWPSSLELQGKNIHIFRLKRA